MKKNWLPAVVLAVLSTGYAVYFAGWFKPRTIEIYHVMRSLHQHRQSDGMPSLIFGLNRPFRITEIKIVPLAEQQTNQGVLPLWHLVSDSNSVPIKAFFYGQFIRGLKPEVPGSRPQPLDTNVTYRLVVIAGRFKGQHDFELK